MHSLVWGQSGESHAMATSSHSTETCLSVQVHRIICETAKLTEAVNAEVPLSDEGLLQWNIIEKLLPSAVSPDAESTDYFVTCVSALSPVSSAVYRHYTSTDLDTLMSELQPYLNWTSQPQILLRCLKLTKSEDSIGPIHSLLMCSSILERSLGDLYLMRGKQCPSMLKDLLIIKELQQMLGDTLLHVLRIMIGPPISLNLRNIVWHGFPCPGEIHPWFSYLLLCVLGSLGELLKDSHILYTSIPHRSWVTFPQVEPIQHALLKEMNITEADLNNVEKLFKHSEFVQSGMVELWLRGVQMYREKRYGDCACLLLPQLEHGLRRCFSVANKCQHRVLTAESTVLFTTLDEILSPHMDNGTENKLRYHIGDQLLTLLLDLLSYPSGPRLRDRVSHGETNLSDTPSSVASVLLSVCVLCALRGYTLNCKNIQNTDVSEVSTVSGDDCRLFKRLLSSLNTYKSLYHPMAIVQSEILKCAFALEKWCNMTKPDPGDIGSNIIWPTEGANVSVLSISAGQAWLQGFFTSSNIPGALDTCVLQPFYDLGPCYQQYLNHPLHTLYRTANDKIKTKEEEIVNLLQQTTQQCHLVAEQVMRVVQERYQQYLRKELRSRQRVTYARMLDSIPVLSGGLRLVLMWCTGTLYAVDHIKTLQMRKQLHMVKLLKNVLQYVELLGTYTSSEKNRWEEAVTITTQITDKVQHAHHVLVSEPDSQ